MPQPKYLILGEILRPHGIRGEIRMRVHTDYPERIRDLETVYVSDTPEPKKPDRYQVASMRMHQGYALILFKGLTNRNQVDYLRGSYVLVDIKDAIPLEADEIYLYQLIGMTVETEAGETIGTISDVLETGANDVYVIQSSEHGEILFPVTDETLINTDLEANRVVVKIPDGLLPS